MDNFVVRIVDDDEEFLDAICFLLATEGWETKGFSTAQKFLREETFNVPGCLILDFYMQEMSGTQLQEKLNEVENNLPIIFLTGHADIDLAVKVFKAGACDFLQKPVKKEKLLEAINNAVTLYQKQMEEKLKHSCTYLFEQLTEREKQIFKKLTSLLSSKEIGEAFGISERTVECHRAKVMKKLNLKKMSDLLQFNRQLIKEREQGLGVRR